MNLIDDLNYIYDIVQSFNGLKPNQVKFKFETPLTLMQTYRIKMNENGVDIFIG